MAGASCSEEEPGSQSVALQHKAMAGEAFAREDYVTASTLYCKALAALRHDTPPPSALSAAGPNAHASLIVILHSNIAECSLRTPSCVVVAMEGVVLPEGRRC